MTKDQLDKKWSKFQKRASLFNHLPFVDFVLGAGSMAMGTAKENSDFDVIVGVRPGRIFTARFLAVAIFTLRGWRRKNHIKEDKLSAKDKICLNHFVAPESYRLRPPHNEYWNKLYQSLVPLLGDREKITTFFNENCVWMKVLVLPDFAKWQKSKRTLTRVVLEFILKGKLGDAIESFLKNVQVKKIEKGIMHISGYKPRIVYSDTELEFHPDTRRIEEIIAR